LNSFRKVVNKAQLLEKGYHDEVEEVQQKSKKLKFNMHQPQEDFQEELMFSMSTGQVSNA
jgi:hypothetical protein